MCSSLADKNFNYSQSANRQNQPRFEDTRMAYDNGSDSQCSDSRSSSLQVDPCYRCCKRVYPLERIDIGVLFHRGCFRCRVCGLQLSLRTFHWDQHNEPDIYCSSHVPKLVGTIDSESMGIKSAVNAPRGKNNVNEQVRETQITIYIPV